MGRAARRKLERGLGHGAALQAVRVAVSPVGQRRASLIVRDGGLVALENVEAQMQRRVEAGRALGDLQRFERIAASRARAADTRRAELVRRARRAGASWARIGLVVGLTAEGARMRYRGL